MQARWRWSNRLHILGFHHTQNSQSSKLDQQVLYLWYWVVSLGFWCSAGFLSYCSNFMEKSVKKACFWEIDLRPAVCSNTILILAHDLGTKNQYHERIINKYSWNGVNRKQNWFPFCIFNKQWMVTIPMSSNGLTPWRIWIPKETIWI